MPNRYDDRTGERSIRFRSMFGRRSERQRGCCRIQHLGFHLGVKRKTLIVENRLAYSRKSGFSKGYAG